MPEVTLDIPRKAEDFSRGDNQSRHMPLPTYLDCCNQFTIILGLHLYLSILKKLLLVVKTLIKNIEQQPH